MSQVQAQPATVVREMLEGLFRDGVQALAAHPGMEDLRRLFPKVKEAIPDISAELRNQVVEGDQVASYFVFRGTHKGTLFGVAGTGRRVEFQNLSIAQVKDGKVVQYNSETGWLAFLMQVGALPLTR
jgi:predicted ester cyclase